MHRVLVKPVSFSTKLLCDDADTSSSRIDLDSLPEPIIDASRPVIVMGSATLGRIAKEKNSLTPLDSTPAMRAPS